MISVSYVPHIREHGVIINRALNKHFNQNGATIYLLSPESFLNSPFKPVYPKPY